MKGKNCWKFGEIGGGIRRGLEGGGGLVRRGIKEEEILVSGRRRGGEFGSLRLALALGMHTEEDRPGLGNEGDVFSSVGCYWFFRSTGAAAIECKGGHGWQLQALVEEGGTRRSGLGRRRAARKDGQERTMCCRLVKAGCRRKEEIREEGEGLLWRRREEGVCRS